MAQALLEQGVRVLAAARSVEELEALRAGAPAGQGAAMRHAGHRGGGALAAEAVDAFGRLDIVVNNAGIAPAGKFVEQSIASGRR